jgi:methionine synthase II (cobalamin-independent)
MSDNTGFRFMATQIGSLPYLDVRGTCLKILGRFPELPFWPQLARRSPVEDMSVQGSEGLPLLEFDEGRRSLVLAAREMEPDFVAFYDRFLAEDTEPFAVSRDYAPGLHELVSCIRENREAYGPFIKGQSVGPVTFAAGIPQRDGKPALHHPDLLDALTKGLAIKARWQVNELEKTGKQPVIFFDEPYLSGFGSAFSPIQREEVVALIREVVGYVKDNTKAVVGIHCCGNTDWSMIAEAGPDIISFDAFGYLDTFLLYPREITRFVTEGGTVAWGIVPTADFEGTETVDDLFSRLERGLNRFFEWGLDESTVARQSILTPACGMGSLPPASADRIQELLAGLTIKCRERF